MAVAAAVAAGAGRTMTPVMADVALLATTPLITSVPSFADATAVAWIPEINKSSTVLPPALAAADAILLRTYDVVLNAVADADADAVQLIILIGAEVAADAEALTVCVCTNALDAADATITVTMCELTTAEAVLIA